MKSAGQVTVYLAVFKYVHIGIDGLGRVKHCNCSITNGARQVIAGLAFVFKKLLGKSPECVI